MRTYSRAHFEAAREAWADFDREWSPFREAAAERGMLYPPIGRKTDSWEDVHPSQRAIIYRAIVDTPDTLMDAINESRTWSDVVAKVFHDLEWRREDAELQEKDAEWDRLQYRGPMQSIGSILSRLKDSMP